MLQIILETYMKQKILLLFIVIQTGFASGQEILNPFLGRSFGINHHTNRDISSFTITDKSGSIYNVGTTEKDSTFTDILITKFDDLLNFEWQKTYSLPTPLSYDAPLKHYFDSNQNLILICRSLYDGSPTSGILFILKFNPTGELLWSQTIGDIDDPEYIHYRHLYTFFENDSLGILYNPEYIEYTTPDGISDVVYFSITSEGKLLQNFSKTIKNDAIQSIHRDGKFYILVRQDGDSGDTDYYLDIISYDYHLHKKLNQQEKFVIEAFNQNLSEFELFVDANENLYVIKPQIEGYNNQEIAITKTDNSGKILYSSFLTENYNLLGNFIDSENNLNLITYDKELDYLTLNQLNEDGVVSTVKSLLLEGFQGSKFDNESKNLIILKNTGEILVFDNLLNLLKTLNTSADFSISDLTATENLNMVVSGTSFEKMFPESDFATQDDIHLVLVGVDGLLNNYVYSGEGTSSVQQQKLIIDQDNNYLVLIKENLGPEFLGIGGADPPLSQRIIKYDQNLNKLWEKTIPEEVFQIVNFGGRETNYYFDDSNNLYFNWARPGDYFGYGHSLYKLSPSGEFQLLSESYLADEFEANQSHIYMSQDFFGYENSSFVRILNKKSGELEEEINIGHENVIKFAFKDDDYYFYTHEEFSGNYDDLIHIYKNGQKIYTRDLTPNYGLADAKVDEEGNLYFITNFTADKRLSKLTVDNNYNYFKVSDDDGVIDFMRYDNGKILVSYGNNNLRLLDDSLNLLKELDPISIYNPYLVRFKNFVFLISRFDNSYRIINSNGDLIDSFKPIRKGVISQPQFDSNDNLVLVGNFGNRIHTFNEYGWRRGFIHKYKLPESYLGFDDLEFEVVENKISVFPNPTINTAKVKISDAEISNIEIFDINGRTVGEFDSEVINLRNLNSGIYILKIKANNNLLYHTKIIKN